MAVSLTSTLPKAEEANGLPSIENELIADPNGLFVAVVVLDVKKITTDVDSSEASPTVRVRRIEPISEAEDRTRLGRLATRAFERRTGQTVLPLDLEDEMRAAFGEDPGDTSEPA